MSGPTYPPSPSGQTAGANSIGAGFVIGSSSIGDLPTFDLWRPILSQYANSPVLIQIIEDIFSCLDQTTNYANFFDSMWNVMTATGYGLDCWGTIVGVNRVLRVGLSPQYLGFDEGDDPAYTPFNQAPWFAGETLTQNYLLTDDGFRVLILAKAFSNICDGGIRSINTLMRMLFGASGRAYVVDNADKTLTYKFEFTPTPVQLAVLTNSGVMPTPTGWSFSVEYPT